MGILSLEKYLYGGRPTNTTAAVDEVGAPTYLEFAVRALSSIRRSVLVGESLADISENVELIRRALEVESQTESISDCADQLDALLEVFQKRNREQLQAQTNEFRHLLDILNDTFAHLDAGTEKSVERFRQLEAGLSKAARLEDLTALRGQLCKMLEYVRSESARDQRETKTAVETLGKQIREVQTLPRARTQLLGRSEALAFATELRAAGGQPQAALFAADSLRAIRIRHGDDLANSILQDAARKHIAGLTPNGHVFCWSPAAVLLIWNQAEVDIPPAQVPSRLQMPLQHRAFVGARMATFSIAVRSVVLPATGAIEDLAEALDRFAQAGPGC